MSVPPVEMDCDKDCVDRDKDYVDRDEDYEDVPYEDGSSVDMVPCPEKPPIKQKLAAGEATSTVSPRTDKSFSRHY